MNVDGLQRGKIVAETFDDGLEDSFRAAEVLEGVLAEIPERGGPVQRASEQFLCAQRQKDLLAVTCGEHPGYPVEGGAEVVAVPLMGDSGVERHPHPEPTERSPILGDKASLDLNGGFEGG